ncbi:WD40-repeat-containing domain protein [Glomus cerebriforme]|uniref:WD40-repeat-containing domain protein n=1 Tax=Glomus cerebriforme TaxID=658196 RepID=A0A397T0C9_9GLOM|nr:WD40-repeat-containing domain protein [Glomus cerebriforme]
MAILKLSFFSKQPESKPWSYPEEYNENISEYLYKRELGIAKSRYPMNYSSYKSDKIPRLMKEHEINLENHDKIFSSHWISLNEVVIGSKCNKLLILNVQTNKRFEIPLVHEQNMDSSQEIRNGSGIRSIAVNPSKTLLAVGAGKPVQVTVYELPSFEPVAIFSGHNDLVFSVAWLDDYHLVSGSRDGTIRLWSIESKIISEMPLLPNKYINVHQPLLARSEFAGKVRDLQFNPKTEQIMTLSTEGYVRLWDASYLNEITKVPLLHLNENVCLAMNSKVNLFAVGSQEHISVVDPRTSSIVHEIRSVDEGCGVRSLCFNDHTITTGGGYGRLSFYDLRAQQYLDFPSRSNSEKSLALNYRETGSGWLNRDSVYMNHFAGYSIQNAIYALSYDESGNKLFTGGGPLQLDLKGSYAAIWT